MNNFDHNLQKKFQNAEFITSATRLEECPAPAPIELAIVGRSNVGKSSVLNCLCHQKKLAKTSKTPGRTQLINFFRIDENLNLIDLPGYGYAKVPLSQQKHWEKELARFLSLREALKGLILIVDIRHGLKPTDHMLIALADELSLPVHLVLNKADKLTRNHANQALAKLKKSLQPEQHNIDISLQIFSATQRMGKESFFKIIEERWLNPN